jgi:mannose-6-phosphate isomerase-like protein (cupin superfamily)
MGRARYNTYLENNMRLFRLDPAIDKGWYAGPWNSSLPISIGYANAGIDLPHLHRQITEIYLIARGTAKLCVDNQTLIISAGDMILVQPGEAHTFLSSSPDYLHFVLHIPGLPEEAARADKILLKGDSLYSSGAS